MGSEDNWLDWIVLRDAKVKWTEYKCMPSFSNFICKPFWNNIYHFAFTLHINHRSLCFQPDENGAVSGGVNTSAWHRVLVGKKCQFCLSVSYRRRLAVGRKRGSRWGESRRTKQHDNRQVQYSVPQEERQSVLLSLSTLFTWTSGDRSICLLHTTAYMCKERPRYRDHAANQQIVPIYRTYSAARWKATDRSERDKEKRNRRENS